MRIRPFAVALATGLTLTTLMSPARAVEDECTITDTSPTSVTIGSAADATIHLDMDTSCPDQEDSLRWYMNIVDPDEANEHNFGWIMAINFHRSQATNAPWIHYDNDDVSLAGKLSNQRAGTNVFQAWGFYGDGDTPDEGDSYMYKGNTLTLLRSTAFTPANATPEPVTKGKKLKITSSFTRADWDNLRDATFSETVSLQFKAPHTTTYVDVKDVDPHRGAISTSIVAKRSGYWRFHFDGDDVSAASNSRSDYVAVKAARKAPVRRTPVRTPVRHPRLIVTPGAFCSDAQLGDIGYSAAGNTYRCTYYPASHRNRWKRV